MIACSVEVYRAAFAHGFMAGLGAKRVTAPAEEPGVQGQTTTAGRLADVQEWHIDGEIVGRRVEACGRKEHWLRRDIAELAEAALDAENAEIERVRADVVAYAREHPPADRRHPPRGLSPALIHAAIRYSYRVGALSDMNSRGDETRARFAFQLSQLEKEPSQ